MQRPAVSELWIVEVRDDREARLSGGRRCTEYSSPPQPLGQALALVAVLLGGPDELPTVDDGPWRLAIAGGRRDVRLHRASADGQMFIA